MGVFKFGRILRVFKLLKFIDEARVLGQALRGSARTIGVFLFSSSCCRLCSATAFL